MAVSLRHSARFPLWLLHGAVLVALGSLAGGDTTAAPDRGHDDDRVLLTAGALCPPPPALAPLITAVPIPLDAVGCALGAADVEVLTQFRRPDGTMLVRRFHTLLGVPALVNADTDLLPDLVVTPTVRNLHEFAARIERPTYEIGQLPVSVELVVNDPTAGGSLPRDRIHLGYDARDTRAPRLFRSVITLGEETNGDPRVQLENTAGYGVNTPAALTVVGGLFDGESLDRSDPLGCRLTYTPMPPTSTVDLGIGDRYRVGLGASQPVALDAEVEMVTGANEKRATAHLDPLPQSVEASYVPGATDDQRTVTVTSTATVADVDLGYRETEGGVPQLGAVVHATDLPTQVTVEQSGARAGSVDTNGAFGSVEVGLADGDPVLGTADGPYLKLVDDGTHSSVAARIDGLRRASVDATDTIVADLQVTPAGRKPVAIDVDRPGLTVTGSVADLPEHLTLEADLDGPVVSYDGHGQGLDDLVVEAVADDPLFARATHLRAHATDIPAAFVFEVRKRHQEPTPGVVLLDGVEVTSSAPIGTVEFEADDGGASVLPADAGATYVDTPARFAIGARVADFERVSLVRRLGGWTDLGTTVGAGPFDVKVQTNDPTVADDALLVQGTVADLPHVFDASVRPPSEQHDGVLEIDASEDIDALDVRIEPQLPLLERPGADPDVAIIGLEDIPAQIAADIVASDTGASVTLDHAIGEVEALLTSGPTGQIGDDGDDSGIYVRALTDQFVAMGRLSDVTALSFAADPIAVDVTTTHAQPFTIDAEVDDPDDEMPAATIEGAVLDLPAHVSFEEVGDGFVWDAHGESIDALTLDADNLPGGSPGDGGVHFADLEIDGIPARFEIHTGTGNVGVQVFDGAAFGRIFAQVSDTAQAPLADPDAAGNRVEVRITDGLTAFVRVHDLRTVLFDPDSEDTSVTFETTAPADLDLLFAVQDVVGGDLRVQNLAPHAEFCLSTTQDGCDSQFESPHPTSFDPYTVPAVFHSYLRTTGADGPLTLNGVVCLRPKGPDVPWTPVCERTDPDGTPERSSAHQVRFADVQLTHYQVDLHSGDSVEVDEDEDPLEDSLLGGYVDISPFFGQVRYQTNVFALPEVYDDESAIEFESFGPTPYSADDWEFVVDLAPGLPSTIYESGSSNCPDDVDPDIGGDWALRMWVLTQYSDLFELDDLSSEVDLCTDQ